MEPTPWEQASWPPNNNIVGEDPQLTDPENGDFRPLSGSPAVDYGCRTFPEDLPRRGIPAARRMTAADDRMPPLRQTTEVSGLIGEDTVWDADTVRVVGDVTVEDGATLSIRPGVRVVFADHFGLFVSGTLQAVGTPGNPIRMTSDAPELFAIDSTTAGSWAGIRFHHTPARNDSSRLEYCVLEYCKAAGDSSRGGVLSVIGASELRVANCIFRMNVADYGAVAYCSEYAAPTICGCLMTENYAFVGGAAVYCADAYPVLTNNTIVDNHVLNEEEFYATAAIHNHISKPRAVNSVIRENSSHYFMGGQLLEAKGFYTIYNDIEGGHAGAGNIDEDPLFIGGGEDPYGLGEGSPCIDAGTPKTDDLWLPAFDLRGSPRIELDRIDMGAYEWQTAADGGAETASGEQSGLRCVPNPFVTGTTISFRSASGGAPTVEIYDVSGRRLRALRGSRTVGAVVWDGTDERGVRVASGIYLARITEDGKARARILVLAR